MDKIPESLKYLRKCVRWAAILNRLKRRRQSGKATAQRYSRTLFIGLILSVVGASAQDHAQPRIRLERFLNELTTFQAKFAQQLFDEYGGLLETASGEVTISKPGKFHWEYQQPYRQLIVTDGTTLWVYDEDLEQVSINPFTRDGPGSPAELLVGEVELDRHYLIAESIGENGIAWISLTPRDSTAQYNAIDIGLDGDAIHAMRLRDNLNQLTDIQFSEIVRNGEIGAERFRFVPPPGVDVMQGPGN